MDGAVSLFRGKNHKYEGELFGCFNATFANSKDFIMPDYELLLNMTEAGKRKSLLTALQDKQDIDFDRGYTSRGPKMLI